MFVNREEVQNREKVVKFLANVYNEMSNGSFLHISFTPNFDPIFVKRKAAVKTKLNNKTSSFLSLHVNVCSLRKQKATSSSNFYLHVESAGVAPSFHGPV